ncbi:MAG: 4-hydroxy-3-methylbut-2-enyl diphosphate reductase [Candidatus Sumerlaea chitinivorans]|nr:4-hydroxy-3-methylbut-2-enyl diphosphate reductase [Candidatus Sumerlaea chitinivorans]
MSPSDNAPLQNSLTGKIDPQTGMYRHGFGLNAEVEHVIENDYRSPVIDYLRQNDFRATVEGLEILLAREFGFCYGVDKAVDYAYQTRRMFPDRRIFLTAEIIHNPGVNQRLREMGIEFLSGRYRSSVTYEDLTPQDIVILPAFGAAVEEIERLRARGCTIVDTTCGSVIHVWKRVEKYARDGFTAVIHGKYRHEETIATSSRVAQFPNGRYVIVRDKDEAQLLCDFITGTCSAEVVRERLGHAASPNFDPARDLVRVGIANQTTMLSSESLEIAEMLRRAMAARYGEAALNEHFRSFDTICSATQDRQDAMHALGELKPQLILVVGGFNSSNTSHLVEIAAEYCPAYHIESVADILSAETLRHKHWAKPEAEVAHGWLPPLPTRIGFTGGASTPDRAIGDVILRVLELYGLTWSPAQK